jgi:hypothetical protein
MSADTTFWPALLVPPLADKLMTTTWSSGILDVDFAMTATPDGTFTETDAVVAIPPFDS